MKGGTRTRRGVIRPPSPVKSASERAGSSSPAPPGSSSGEVVVSVSGGSSAVGGGAVSVVSDSVSVVSDRPVAVVGCSVVSDCVSLEVEGSSSSPPAAGEGQHEADRQNAGERPIEGDADQHGANT